MSSVGRMHELALERVPFAIVITNPHLPDNPIVFVNNAFTKLTGYSAEAAIGRNCRFLQGDDTDPEVVSDIRQSLARIEEFSVEITNYKFDGTPFLNRLYVTPVSDDQGELSYFLGMQRASGTTNAADRIVNETDDALREIHHRVKNHLSMVVGMIRMQARTQTADSHQNYATLARRIETLQLLYHEMTTGGTSDIDDKDIALGAYVSRIASAIAYLDGRESLRLNLALGNVRAPIDVAARVGLLVSELLTNAYQHAFKGREEGLITVHLSELTDGTVRLAVEDDGVGLPEGLRWPETGGLGGRIVRSLVTGLGASLSVANGGLGSVFTLDIPNNGSGLAKVAAADRTDRRVAGNT